MANENIKRNQKSCLFKKISSIPSVRHPPKSIQVLLNFNGKSPPFFNQVLRNYLEAFNSFRDIFPIAKSEKKEDVLEFSLNCFRSIKANKKTEKFSVFFFSAVKECR